MKVGALAAMLLLLSVPVSSFAQDSDASDVQVDIPGAADHPAIARFPGFYIDGFERNDFNEHAFVTGFDKKSGEFTEVTKEGRYWWLEYIKRDGVTTPSLLEIQRNYERAFAKAGGKLVFLTADREKATFQQKTDDGERWVEVLAENGGTMIRLHIIELAGLTKKVEFSASEMRDALDRDGFIALNGILFDTGKDQIKPESEALLNEVLALLRDNPKLNLSIDGHTDNAGDAAANDGLSRRRAESVRQWLLGHGIAAPRLVAQGFGASRPVADNRTEAGRTQNRRVELVKR